jgi:hypothetical protein
LLPGHDGGAGVDTLFANAVVSGGGNNARGVNHQGFSAILNSIQSGCQLLKPAEAPHGFGEIIYMAHGFAIRVLSIGKMELMVFFTTAVGMSSSFKIKIDKKVFIAPSQRCCKKTLDFILSLIMLIESCFALDTGHSRGYLYSIKVLAFSFENKRRNADTRRN